MIGDASGKAGYDESWESLGSRSCRASGGDDHSTCIVIVNDDEESRHSLADYLTAQGMSVACAARREDILLNSSACRPTLVLLELQSEKDEGLDLLQEIRSRASVPIIITTEHRREEMDRVIGLELGADDYITRPFNPRELLARMRAVLRRYGLRKLPSKHPFGAGCYRFGGWHFNQRTRELLNPQGMRVPLTKGQCALLAAFLATPGQKLTREHLLQATHMRDDAFDRSIDVQVLRLRRKLEPIPNAPHAILTERGVGYRFALPVEYIPRLHFRNPH